MADHNHQELINLCSLVVKLSRELDYKNQLLMQKEGVSLEKFATLSCLVEEKDRLLEERSEVIGALMAQKYRLHEAFVEGMQNYEHLKLELRKVEHASEKQKNCHPIRELVEYQAETDKGLVAVSASCLSDGGRMKSPKIDLVVLDKSDDEKQKSLIVPEAKLEIQYLRAHAEELKMQIDSLKTELDKKGKTLSQLETLHQNILSKEHSSNEELQEARKEAMNCLQTVDSKVTKFGIKRMGEINPQAFRDACAKKVCDRNRKNFINLYSAWQDKVNDHSWKPFNKGINNGKEVIDEHDVKLGELRKQLGEEAYKVVTNALIDLNEYNPDLRQPIPELWNFDEGRRAGLKEVIQFITEQWKAHRDTDNEQSAAIIEIMSEKERLLKQLEEVDILMGEKDKLLNEKYATIGELMAQIAEKDKLLGILSATASSIITEKHVLHENCMAGKSHFENVKEQVDKVNNDMQTKREGLESQTKQLEERNINHHSGKQTMMIKVESVDDHIVSLNKRSVAIPKELQGIHVSKRMGTK